MNYAVGFVTGANYHAFYTRAGNSLVGKDTSPEALLAAIELYCSQNPLKDVGDALGSVYSELILR